MCTRTLLFLMVQDARSRRTLPLRPTIKLHRPTAAWRAKLAEVAAREGPQARLPAAFVAWFLRSCAAQEGDGFVVARAEVLGARAQPMRQRGRRRRA